MRLIDADGLTAICNRLADNKWNANANTTWSKAYDYMTELIDEQPTIEAEPTKHGEWVGVSPQTDSMECSVCGYVIQSEELETPYCPWCGAKMEDNWNEPEINPCRGCRDYDGKGGCISNGGCGRDAVEECLKHTD